MKGSVKINGVDIADLGVFILRGGDYDFLTFPDRKLPAQNSWHEYDGLDVDLTEVYFKERAASIHFYISADDAQSYNENINAFYTLITEGYVELYTREFDRTFSLRYLSGLEYNHKGGMYKQGDKRARFKVNFSLDDPLQLFTNPTIIVPNTKKPYPASGIILNGIDLAEFGIAVNQCYSSMFQQPAIKAPLTRSFARHTGLSAYPRQRPTFEAKEITIKCTMRADSRAEFYYNYEALFNNLTKPEALQIDSYLGSMSSYYSKMESFKKMGVFSNGILVSFTLRLMQIDAITGIKVLATEWLAPITTHDGKLILIM